VLLIGLEALVLKSSSSSGKETRIVQRLTKIAKSHDPAAEWENALKALWRARADIVHEGFGASSDGMLPEIGAAEINEVKYLFIIALLYVLELRTNGASWDELWDPRHLDHYVPGVTFRPDEMPILFQVINLQRSSRRWAGRTEDSR
jgi:hypothetical protein